MTNRKVRCIKSDDSKYFIRWLIANFPKEQDKVALELLAIGRDKYGSTASNASGVRLRQWAAPRGEGGGHVPKWVYLAALDLAIERGFKPHNIDEQAILEHCLNYKITHA